MLNFLRRYQKVVFGAVTAALIVSISFFGSYGAIASRPAKEEDSVIGTAIDGSNMSKLQIDKMVRFLATDKLDTEVVYKRAMPNFFNHGVIRFDFLQTGLAQMLVESYFDEVKDDLLDRVEKQKRFKAYVHPVAPFLSAENIWSQFFPSLYQSMQKVRAEDFVVSPQNFKILADLYLDSSRFPSSLMRRFLSYQESQHAGLMKDPYLAEGDLSLFYFHDLEDWFGKNFIELVAQCIYNSALYAKQKGYKVSYEEAKADLLRGGYEALAEQGEITAEMLDKYWKETLFTLRLQERDAVHIWQQVMLFRKMFEDYGQSVFLDKHSYDVYNASLSTCVEVERYILPKEMQVGDFRSLLKLQLYLESIAEDKKEAAYSLGWPQKIKKIEDLALTAPQLVEKVCEVEMSHITRDEAAMAISLKDTWAWEAKGENWAKLKTEFKELSTIAATEDHLEVLDRLSDARRMMVDQFARREILKESSSLITQALAEKPLEKKRLHLALGGKDATLMGVHDSAAFVAALQQGDEAHLTSYTQDGMHYYRIHVQTLSDEVRLLSFQEASDRGVLDDLVEEKLRQFHAKAQSMQPALFQKEDGSYKEFASVKDQIGKLMYKKLLEDIEKDFVQHGGKLQVGPQREPLEFYASHRFYHLMQEAKKDIQEKGTSSAYLLQGPKLAMQREKLHRKKIPSWATEEIFALQEKSFSQLQVSSQGEISFCQVLGKFEEEIGDLEAQVQEGQRLLAQEAKKLLMQEILSLLSSTDSIHLEKIADAKPSAEMAQ